MLAWVPVLLLLAQSHCPTVKVQVLTHTWTHKDDLNLKRAEKRCGEIYPGNPCLITFIKVDDSTYRAVCGAKR